MKIAFEFSNITQTFNYSEDILKQNQSGNQVENKRVASC